MSGVKRFEILAHVRDQITLHGPFGAALDDRVSKGLRLYEFGDSATVLNSAVNASVLFLDLRGFTKTSEGHISERDLTRELYTVFDEFVPHVRRFGGSVDKFLGDGIMVNYGTDHLDPLNPLNALRTAILCQETLQRMREEGTTYFKMGIAIHYGRVHIARFIADEEAVQTTVIGRNVNPGQNILRFFVEVFPCRGQGNGVLAANDKCNSDFVFQALYLATQGRLRQV